MSELSQLLTVNLATVLGLMCLLWIVSLVRRDTSVVDPFWGTGFVVVVWLSCLQAGTSGPRPLLLAVLTTVWGLRCRRISGGAIGAAARTGDIGRCAEARLAVLVAQPGDGFSPPGGDPVVCLFALAVRRVAGGASAVGVARSRRLRPLDARFRVRGRGRLAARPLRIGPGQPGTGSRPRPVAVHAAPELLRRFLRVVGIVLDCCRRGAWWTIPGPLLMSWLLMRVSGVPLLEKDITERRAGYADYVARTSAFFPAPPRSE